MKKKTLGRRFSAQSGRQKLKEFCNDKDDSIPVGAGRCSVSGRRRGLRPIRGEAIYKAKCAMCHGAAGTPSAGMAKMGVKPVSDPAIKKLTADADVCLRQERQGQDAGRSTGLTDAQIKDVITFFRGMHMLNPQPLPPGL